jgi:NAD-dependent SIR2 family protein deacetylase
MNNLIAIKNILQQAKAILITAGAGIGVDSGLPDFRGNEGFWKAYPPIKKLGLSFSQMANPMWFEEKPKLAWAFYGHRLNLYRQTIPHDGFKMLLDLVKHKNDNYFIFTSNVDGQFQKAGFSSDKIYEIHGSIHHLQCFNNCSDEIWNNEEEVEVDDDNFLAKNIPTCPKCKSIARPNILMFGDWGWNEKRTFKQEQNYAKWLNENKNISIAIIELGAGTAIPSVRNESQNIARTLNAHVMRINPRDYHINTSLGFGVPLGALEGLKTCLL